MKPQLLTAEIPAGGGCNCCGKSGAPLERLHLGIVSVAALLALCFILPAPGYSQDQAKSSSVAQTATLNQPAASITTAVADSAPAPAGTASVASAASPNQTASAPVTQQTAALPGAKDDKANKDDKAAPASSAAAAPAASNASPFHGNFFARLGQAYWADWHPNSSSSDEEPKRRGFPAPVDGPPFPFSDWPYGGSVVLGTPWTQSAPLMQALWSGPNGDAWKRSGIQIYGWFNGGANLSTSDRPGFANLPTAYAEKPDTITPDQQVLYIEKQPDTVQTDHVDWGFRVASIYGLDYRFTTAKGIFSQQLLNNFNSSGVNGHEYGFDPVMMYLDFYLPHIAQGMDVRVGRYISLPDIEAQLAPNNYTYTHSLTYTYDCYTQTGINTTTKFNDNWKLQAGVSAGCEATPWTKAPDSKLTFNTCLIYEWNGGKDNIYPCANAINSGKYAYNNLNAFYFTWYHKFGNSAWHTDTEWWYQYERQVPNVDPGAPVAAASILETNANGAFCRQVTDVTCFAPDEAVVNYVERQFGKHDYLTIRNEVFDDIRGQRTGFKSLYTEHLLGWGHWIGTTILFRPELRFERSYDVPAYDNGHKKNQLMLSSDMIWFF